MWPWPFPHEAEYYMRNTLQHFKSPMWFGQSLVSKLDLVWSYTKIPLNITESMLRTKLEKFTKKGCDIRMVTYNDNKNLKSICSLEMIFPHSLQIYKLSSNNIKKTTNINDIYLCYDGNKYKVKITYLMSTNGPYSTR